MKITNKYNLPSAFVNIAKEEYAPKEFSIGVTTLLKPTLEILLTRRYHREIEQDVSDMVWLIFGKAVHHIMESADKTGNAEIKYSIEIQDGYSLTGVIDLYDEIEFTCDDYKTASVWKVIREDDLEWYLQGMMYAWLLRAQKKHVEKVRFHALLKDWSAADKRKNGSNYPAHPVHTECYTVTTSDMIFIERFIRDKFIDILKYEHEEDDAIPTCMPDERWNTGDRFAVYKRETDTKAYRLYDTESEAHDVAMQINGIVKNRPGEDKKCRDYCLVNRFCPYWSKKNDT